MAEELNVNPEAQADTEPSEKDEKATETTEVKPEEGNGEPEIKKGEPEAKEGEPEVPESYEFPEDLELTEEEKAEYNTLLKKHKATQEAANDVIELLKKQGKAIKEASINAWYDQVKKWGKEAENHEEYGGAKFEENLRSVITPVLNKFGDEQLIKELDQTGFGNNPRLLAFLYRVGKEIGIEAGFAEGKQGSGDEENILKTLYPTMFKDNK